MNDQDYKALVKAHKKLSRIINENLILREPLNEGMTLLANVLVIQGVIREKKKKKLKTNS